MAPPALLAAALLVIVLALAWVLVRRERAHRATAAQLRAGEERLEALTLQAPGGLYHVDPQGYVTFASDRWCEMAGRTQEQMAGAFWPDLVHPDDRGTVHEEWQRSVEQGTPLELEYRLMHPDGEVRWVSGRSTEMYDADGALSGFAGGALDVTARHVAEQDRRMRAQITAHMSEGVVLVRHSDNQIVFTNSRFDELFGYDEGQMLGMDATRLNADGRRGGDSTVRQILGAVERHGAWRGEIHNVRRNGTRFWSWANVSAFEHPEHGMVSLSIQSDVTERKRVDDELRNERRLLAEAQAIGRVGSWEIKLSDASATWSEEMVRLHGMPPGSRPPRRYLALVHPDDRAKVRAEAVEAINHPGDFEIEYRIVGPDGLERMVQVHGAPAADGTRRLAGTARDVTSAREAERALRVAEERFHSAFADAPIGMALTNLDGTFREVNQALADLTGYPAEELEGKHFSAITHPDDVAADAERIRAVLEGEADTFKNEKRYLHASGNVIWVSVQGAAIRDADGRPVHLLQQVVDVSERRSYEAKLQHMADHDPLTGLLNRRSFERELEEHTSRVDRYGAEGAAIVLDVDHFKYVNDTHGHNVGDELIVRVAQVLRERLRDTDVLARLGGDEFAVLLPREKPESATAVAEDLLEQVRTVTSPGGSGTRPRRLTASVGVAAFTGEDGLTGEDVLVNADLAMYDAKEAGRDQVSVARTDGLSEARMKGRVTWAERIRRALEEDRFVLLAQPIVDLATGKASQYELLLRMRDDTGDLIPPGAFLAIAERLDLIQDIDRWVTSRAIDLLAHYRAAGANVTFEVNLSGLSIGDPKLLELIEHRLTETGVSPSWLIFEVTETSAVANIPRARAFGERLSELGCRFALDDFGAGFGSFYYLKHLPFDYLKIDGEFVRNCVTNATDRLIVKSVVGIARGLHKKTIAEFVGDEETVRALNRLGVDYAQGYHTGKPAPLEDLIVVEGAAKSSV
ncbi:MAG TPA: EAL domain-containing protein [Thermoleophilaceae bacterium]|nr:EAL domain-containing protein [Thermoleophilaceae bacterium]